MNTKHKEKSFLISISSLTTLALTLPFFTSNMGALCDTKSSCDIRIMWITEIILVIIIVILIISSRRKSDDQQSENMQIVSEPMSHYNLIRQKHEELEQRRLNEMIQLVTEYVQHTLSPYMTEADVNIVCSNIKLWANDERITLRAVATDGRLSSLDIRHFAWNIGERLGWNGHKRALFAKMVFPVVMKDIEVSTIRRNLRHRGTCIIELDTPEYGDLRFSFQHA